MSVCVVLKENYYYFLSYHQIIHPNMLDYVGAHTHKINNKKNNKCKMMDRKKMMNINLEMEIFMFARVGIQKTFSSFFDTVFREVNENVKQINEEKYTEIFFSRRKRTTIANVAIYLFLARFYKF